jgi:putative membrane protein
MFIDYVTLLLVNMAAGLLVLAGFVFVSAGKGDCKKWCPPFAATGLIALLGGVHMTLTWPLPGSYNILFGEMSVLLGAVFLGMALATSREWGLLPIGLYAVLPGAVAVLLGIRVIDLGMTKSPILAGCGFMLSGLSGVLLLPVVWLKNSRVVRSLASLVILAAAVIWVLVGFGAYWGHAESFGEWKPPIMERVKSE